MDRPDTRRREHRLGRAPEGRHGRVLGDPPDPVPQVAVAPVLVERRHRHRVQRHQEEGPQRRHAHQRLRVHPPGDAVWPEQAGLRPVVGRSRSASRAWTCFPSRDPAPDPSGRSGGTGGSLIPCSLACGGGDRRSRSGSCRVPAVPEGGGLRPVTAALHAAPPAPAPAGAAHSPTAGASVGVAVGAPEVRRRRRRRRAATSPSLSSTTSAMAGSASPARSRVFPTVPGTSTGAPLCVRRRRRRRAGWAPCSAASGAGASVCCSSPGAVSAGSSVAGTPERVRRRARAVRSPSCPALRPRPGDPPRPRGPRPVSPRSSTTSAPRPARVRASRGRLPLVPSGMSSSA